MQRRADAFLGRHPLFGAAMAAALCVLAAGRDSLKGFAAVFLISLLAGVFLHWRRGLGWGLCALVAVVGFKVRSDRQHEQERLLPGRWAHSVAVITENARGTERFWSAPARLQSGAHRGVLVRWHGRGELPVAGSWVRASGNFTGLPEPRNPGEFHEGNWLRREGIAAIFETDRRPTEVFTGERAARLAAIRAGFRHAIAAGLSEDSPAARTIRAVVLGEHPADGGELAEHYRLSGTLHIFSVSGLHVGMVGLLGWLVLSRLGVPRRWAIVGMLPLVFGYSWISGNSAPAVRAAWMMAVFLGAFALRRKPDILNALGGVLLAMLLWDGRLLFQPGVQLSYGVVAVIALGTSLAARGFQWMRTPELYLPESQMSWPRRLALKFRVATAQSFAVSSAASVGSTPLSIMHFGLVTPASIPATVTLVPMVFVLLATALVSACVYPIVPAISQTINRANGWLASACGGVARAFTAIPGSHLHIHRADEPFLLVYDLGFGAGAACFADGHGSGVLLDCGDRRGFRRQVVASLRHFGIKPDSVIISHPDGSHAGGGDPIWEVLPIRQALLPVEQSLSPAYRGWQTEAPRHGVKLFHAAEIRGLPMPDGARLEVVFRPDPQAMRVAADDRVALYRLHWQGWRILFASDCGHLVEEAALRTGADLAAEVIVVGRHEKDSPLSDDFLDAVRPLAIVASNSQHPPEQRLPERQATYWRSRGIHVIDQGDTGAVTLKPDPAGGMTIKGFVDGSKLRITRQ